CSRSVRLHPDARCRIGTMSELEPSEAPDDAAGSEVRQELGPDVAVERQLAEGVHAVAAAQLAEGVAAKGCQERCSSATEVKATPHRAARIKGLTPPADAKCHDRSTRPIECRAPHAWGSLDSTQSRAV